MARSRPCEASGMKMVRERKVKGLLTPLSRLIAREVDIVEEILRIYGYNNIHSNTNKGVVK